MLKSVPKFNRQNYVDFGRVLRKRVNEYFEQNNLKRTGDYRIAIKAMVMFGLLLVPYGIMVAFPLNPWQAIACWVIMGIGVAGIGLAIMHDANHGSISSKKWVNDLLGYSLNLIGGSALAWRIQHNVLHHSFTNVKGLDEDLEGGNIMRFTPHEPWKKRHRYQHIYAWLLYSLLTFSWVLAKDFRRTLKYHRLDLLRTQGVSLGYAMFSILLSKIFYVTYIIVVPIMVGYSPGLVIGGFLLMHLISGLMLASIFQPAHIMEDHEFMPDSIQEIDGVRESHQLLTTSNFANENKLLTWFCGGLNYQIEHHIFPNICHIHYPAISKIVKQTAEEHGLPYRSIPTFSEAIAIHQRTMRKLSMPSWSPKPVESDHLGSLTMQQYS
ncbi:MAG: acyl-CoA desaturase [Salibacteraceae bacterium]